MYVPARKPIWIQLYNLYHWFLHFSTMFFPTSNEMINLSCSYLKRKNKKRNTVNNEALTVVMHLLGHWQYQFSHYLHCLVTYHWHSAFFGHIITLYITVCIVTQEVTVTSIISTQNRLSVHFDSWEEQECKIEASFGWFHLHSSRVKSRAVDCFG